MGYYQFIHELLKKAEIRELVIEKDKINRKLVDLWDHTDGGTAELRALLSDLGLEILNPVKKEWSFDDVTFLNERSVCVFVAIEYLYEKMVTGAATGTDIKQLLRELMKKLVTGGVLVVCEKRDNLGLIRGAIRDLKLFRSEEKQEENDVYLLIRKLPAEVQEKLS